MSERIINDDTLEMIDPNDNAKRRFQFRVFDAGLICRRTLPPASIGDRWRDDDIDQPWWEPVLELNPISPIADFARTRLSMPLHKYPIHARYIAGHVVAYTPNGREVRHHRDGGLEVQPHNDNYWLRAPDLAGARRAYFRS